MTGNEVAITQIVTLLTVIIGFLVQLYREKRNRKWDIEDRERARTELRGQINDQTQEIKDKIDETSSGQPSRSR